MGGTNHSHATKDLYDAIAAGGGGGARGGEGGVRGGSRMGGWVAGRSRRTGMDTGRREDAGAECDEQAGEMLLANARKMWWEGWDVGVWLCACDRGCW